MDLANLNTKQQMEAGADLHLKHPSTREPLFADDDKGKKPMVITLMGIDGETFQRIRRQNQRAAMKRRDPVEPAEAEKQGLDTLVAITKGWKNIVLSGEELAFTAENVRRVYAEFPWIREQVNEFASDRANFISA